LEPTVGLAARNRSAQGGSIGLQSLTTGSNPGHATNIICSFGGRQLESETYVSKGGRTTAPACHFERDP
jgi:hypothetical protein